VTSEGPGSVHLAPSPWPHRKAFANCILLAKSRTALRAEHVQTISLLVHIEFLTLSHFCGAVFRMSHRENKGGGKHTPPRALAEPIGGRPTGDRRSRCDSFDVRTWGDCRIARTERRGEDRPSYDHGRSPRPEIGTDRDRRLSLGAARARRSAGTYQFAEDMPHCRATEVFENCDVLGMILTAFAHRARIRSPAPVRPREIPQCEMRRPVPGEQTRVSLAKR